jgi:hypothetical protein
MLYHFSPRSFKHTCLEDFSQQKIEKILTCFLQVMLHVIDTIMLPWLGD